MADTNDTIYLTEISLKELLEGKIIHDDETLIIPPKTNELGIMIKQDVGKTDEPVIIESSHRWHCPKCENEWMSRYKYPCPKCDRMGFLRQRYKELGSTDEEIEELLKSKGVS